MRKRTLVGALLLSAVTLSGCAKQNSETPITKSIKKLREGAILKGNYIQTRKFYTDETFKTETTIEGQSLENESAIEFKFGKDAFARKIETKISETEYAPYIDQAFFKDDFGYAYTEYLSHENKVERSYYGKSEDNLKSFAALGFCNPFNEIYESDLTKRDDGMYDLNLSKASNIFYTLLSSFASGIVNVPKECVVALNAKSEFSTITYSPVTRYVIDKNDQGTGNIYYTVEQTATLFVTSSGDSFIEHKTPITSKENLSELEMALTTFDGSNVTALYEVKDTTNPDSPRISNYAYYYDGSAIFVKQYSDGGYGDKDNIDPNKDYLLTKNLGLETYEARGYFASEKKWVPSNKTSFGRLNQDRYLYKDFLLSLETISPTLFSFDNKTATYVCDNEAASHIASTALQPFANELRIKELGHATKISLEIGASSNVSKIIVDYEYVNLFSSSLLNKGTVTIRLTRDGNTVIPYDAMNNLGGDK